MIVPVAIPILTIVCWLPPPTLFCSITISLKGLLYFKNQPRLNGFLSLFAICKARSKNVPLGLTTHFPNRSGPSPTAQPVALVKASGDNVNSFIHYPSHVLINDSKAFISSSSSFTFRSFKSEPSSSVISYSALILTRRPPTVLSFDFQ